MDEIYLLWFLSISMLICSFISGLVPMAFKLSDSKSRLLALLGSGILVGTALAIIIPEGIDSLYGQRVSRNSHTGLQTSKKEHDNLEFGETTTKSPTYDSMAAQAMIQDADSNMTWTIGISLIVGFMLMLLIDQFSIYQSAGHHNYHHREGATTHYEIFESPRLGNYTLASQDDENIDIGLEEDNRATNDVPMSETKPIKNTNSHNITVRSTIATNANSIPQDSNARDISDQVHINNIANPNRYYDHSRHIASGHRVKNTKVTPTLGLVIHAAADGIALGAAATTSHRDVEMIIFLAIMLHKAPAAFSLVVLLLHNGLKPPTIRKHLLAFSLSAPIAAIVTYYGLSQQGKEALRKNNATGVAMLFSAGTFLFVATVHVLPELIQNKLLSSKELLFLLGGAFLPLILAQTV